MNVTQEKGRDTPGLSAGYPPGECAKDTVARVVLLGKDHCPRNKDGKKLVIAAHGNSLRALVKYLDRNIGERMTG